MLSYITLIYEFFKVGLFSIGGGLATLPFLFEIAEKYPWFTPAELTDMIAVSESTPGPIGVNMATFAGFKMGGILGGITATLSLVLPSIIVILIIARVLEKFKDSVFIKDIFYGLRAAVVGLISASVVGVLMETFYIQGAGTIFQSFDIKKLVLFAILLFLVFRFKKHPVFYIAIGGILGVLFRL